MRKRYFLTATLVLGITLCGCEAKSEEEIISSAIEDTKETESAGIEEITEEPAVDEVIELREEKTSGTVLEDEDALYFIGEDRICRYEKDSNSSQYIWESEKKRTEDTRTLYKDAGGILIGNNLYFIKKEKEDVYNDRYTLSMVCTDGSGYTEICEIGNNTERTLSVADNVLYYEYDRDAYTLKGYAIAQNGQLLLDEPVASQLEKISSEGYSMPYYYKQGYRMLNYEECKTRYGVYLLRNGEYRYCLVDPETGVETSLPERLDSASLFAVNDTDWFFVDYSEQKMFLYDPQTGEVRDLGAYNTDSHIIDMDDEYLYQQTMVSGDDYTQYHYERVSLDTGETEDLFVKDRMVGLGITDPQDAMEPVFLNGYLYYPGEEEYKLYVMRRAVDMPNAEERPGDAFYDSRIGELGYVKTQKNAIYGQKDPQYATVLCDLEWLVLDEKYEGAEKINLILEEEQMSTIQYEKDNALIVEEAWNEEEDTYYYYYSFESALSPFYYWDGTYLSFTQQNYDYMGGAHGMPYWVNYVFNVHTGERLALGDIVAEDEDQIKELVTQAFTLRYEKDPDIYWENAVDCVFEYTCMDSPFYLTEEGIVFYFAPYELAPFSAGFQEVLVPYDAWTLKIDLK